MGAGSHYVPLHVHSMFSLLDGLSKPSQIAERCIEIGANACAITDHGNIAGSVKFYTEMKKNNIKPILGCELYICKLDPSIQDKSNRDLSHFIVLAKNYEGWRNLVKIISESNRPDYYYHKPRLDLDTLSKINNGNLIAITGHLGSTLADEVLDNYELKASWKELGIAHVEYLKNNFSHVFLEAQLMDKDNLEVQVILTKAIREIAMETNTKVICTPDAHYCKKEDAVDQRILLCNNLKTTFPEINRKLSNNEDIPMGCFFNSDNYHILSQEEMQSLHTIEEINNTQFVANLIEEYDILSKPQLPPFDCPKGYSDAEYLRELCRKGWKEKIANVIPQEQHQKYVDRIKYELDVLQGADLSSYFLIVQDIVNYVRNNGWLPGPGRGCFVPDTKVKMVDGTLKPIQQICIGNTVIDAYGNPQEVYSTLEYDIEEDIIELEFENGPTIRCTKDHKFLTNNRGWVEAELLDDNDDIVEV